MCFDIGIVTCGPNEALVVSGMGYGEIDPDTKEYRPFVVMGRFFHDHIASAGPARFVVMGRFFFILLLLVQDYLDSRI